MVLQDILSISHVSFMPVRTSQSVQVTQPVSHHAMHQCTKSFCPQPPNTDKPTNMTQITAANSPLAPWRHVIWHADWSPGILFVEFSHALSTKTLLKRWRKASVINMSFLYTDGSFAVQACVVWTTGGFVRLFAGSPFCEDHAFSGKFSKASPLLISV